MATSNKKDSTIQLVCFDLDGTLADSLPAMYRVYCDFLDSQGAEGTREGFDEINGPSLPEIVRILKRRHGLGGGEDELHSAYLGLMEEAYRTYVSPMDGAADALGGLRGMDMKLALVTSAAREIASAFVDKCGWAEYFDAIAAGDEVAAAKPAPDIYMLALERTATEAGCAAAIEDSPGGIRSAKAAGLFTIGFAGSQKGARLAAAGADSVISNLRDVPMVFYL